MTLSEELKTMSKCARLLYKLWAEKAGGVTYGVISLPIDHNNAKVSYAGEACKCGWVRCAFGTQTPAGVRGAIVIDQVGGLRMALSDSNV